MHCNVRSADLSPGSRKLHVAEYDLRNIEPSLNESPPQLIGVCYSFWQPAKRLLIPALAWKFFHQLSGSVSFQQTETLNQSSIIFTERRVYVLFCDTAHTHTRN